MATNEQGEFFRVSIIPDKPPGVIVRIEGGNYAGYPQTREYPSLPDLKSEVQKDRVLGMRRAFLGAAAMFIGEASMFVSAATIIFGESDAPIKILALATGAAATFAGLVVGSDGIEELRQASAILGRVLPTMEDRFIAPTPPQS